MPRGVMNDIYYVPSMAHANACHMYVFFTTVKHFIAVIFRFEDGKFY